MKKQERGSAVAERKERKGAEDEAFEAPFLLTSLAYIFRE